MSLSLVSYDPVKGVWKSKIAVKTTLTMENIYSLIGRKTTDFYVKWFGDMYLIVIPWKYFHSSKSDTTEKWSFLVPYTDEPPVKDGLIYWLG